MNFQFIFKMQVIEHNIDVTRQRPTGRITCILFNELDKKIIIVQQKFNQNINPR